LRWSKTLLWTKTFLVRLHLLKKLVEIKLLVGQGSKCNRKNSMIVSDNTIEAEGLGLFFKNLGKKGLNVSEKMAKNVFKNPGPALDITANVASALAIKNPEAA